MYNEYSFEGIREKLLCKRENVWCERNEKEILEFSEDYKIALNSGKTEREFAKFSKDFLLSKGFREFNEPLQYERLDLNSAKLLRLVKGKVLIAFIGGEVSIENGINVVAAHIDSPRLDLKQNPLYEDSNFAYFDTHYYGGIKAYQWLSIPLSIHGEIIRKDGSSLNIVVGEDDKDPVFVITDILPHLARDFKEKKIGDVFKGEDLDVLIGGLPLYFKSEEKEAVKLNILRILNEKYNIVEEDLSSAEIEVVPRGNALDLGFDRSMIIAYGQDDRICAYTALRAIAELNTTTKLSSMVILLDKEEIGSEGNTGAKARIIESFLEDLIISYGVQTTTTKVFLKSNCLSGDVSAAFDPHYKDVFEARNSAYFNKGVVVNKFTGIGGKSGSSDASAEFVGKIRKLFNDNCVKWQTAELGKVDVGGGGTVAKFFAERGMEVLDCGPAILSMHAPYEISSKADLYETYRAYLSFLQSFS